MHYQENGKLQTRESQNLDSRFNMASLNHTKPGQGALLQVLVSVSLPTQSIPPKVGLGLSHLLLLPALPPPHITLQSLQGLNEPHLPSRVVAVNRVSGVR